MMKGFRSLPAMVSDSDAVPELPFEIITEILSWLPVDALLRFKCVCKKWRSLLLDYKFIAKHMVRAKPLQLSYQIEWEPNKLNTTFYDPNFKCISSSEAGLLLEKSLTSGVYRIRNFATHQVLYLPDQREGTVVMGLAFDSYTGECKVVCFSVYSSIKVLSIGKDDHWRTFKLPNQNHGILSRRYFCVVVNQNEAAHAMDFIRDGKVLKLEVQSFDPWSECFTITTLPQGAFLDLNRVAVIRWNYHVAVADIVQESLHVWVLEDFKEHKWRNIVVPLNFLKGHPWLKDQIRPHGARSDDLHFHSTLQNCIIVYDMKRGVITATRTKSTEKSYQFRKPSLVTLKGMNNEN